MKVSQKIAFVFPDHDLTPFFIRYKIPFMYKARISEYFNCMEGVIYFYNSILFFLISIGHLFFYKRIFNRLYFIFIISVAYNNFYYGLYYSGYLSNIPYLYGTISLVLPVTLGLIPPLMRYTFEPGEEWHPAYYLLLIPALIRLSLLYKYWSMDKRALLHLIEVSRNTMIPEDLYDDPNLIFSSLLTAIYLIYIVIYFKKRISWEKLKEDYKKKGAGYNIMNIMKYWIGVHFSLMIFIALSYKHLDPAAHFLLENLTNISALFVLLFIPLIPFLVKKGVFSYPGDGWNFTQYNRSRLEGLDINDLSNRLCVAMIKDKIYRDELITLKKLAKQLGITEYQLSELINTRFSKNFNELINSYRTEDVKKTLETEPDTNILQACYNAGFNSVTTFYRVFKKLENCTPEEWRRQHVENIADKTG